MTDDSYDTLLDMRGKGALTMCRWIISNLSSRDIEDVRIRIDVQPSGDAQELPQHGDLGAVQQPYGSPDDLNEGSRLYDALALLVQETNRDQHGECAWIRTRDLYEADDGRFRDKTDLSAALSRLFNQKHVVLRRETDEPNVHQYRAVPTAYELFDDG